MGTGAVICRLDVDDPNERRFVGWQVAQRVQLLVGSHGGVYKTVRPWDVWAIPHLSRRFHDRGDYSAWIVEASLVPVMEDALWKVYEQMRLFRWSLAPVPDCERGTVRIYIVAQEGTRCSVEFGRDTPSLFLPMIAAYTTTNVAQKYVHDFQQECRQWGIPVPAAQKVGDLPGYIPPIMRLSES